MSLMLRPMVSRPVSVLVKRHLGRPDFYYCQTFAGLLMWDAFFFDERTGLSFTIAAGLRQRSLSRFRAPWSSPAYFTVSDSILPFPSPPMTRQGYNGGIKPRLHTRLICKRQSHTATDGHSISNGAHDQILITL
jgi:hypothetical protein